MEADSHNQVGSSVWRYCVLALMPLLFLTSCSSPKVRRHVKAMAEIRDELVSHPPGDPQHSDLLAEYQRHRAELVRVGHLDRKVFPVSGDAMASSNLWNQVRSGLSSSDVGDALLTEDRGSRSITIWDRPKRMAYWTSLLGRPKAEGLIRGEDFQ
jgi:hypothetical protein